LLQPSRIASMGRTRAFLARTQGLLSVRSVGGVPYVPSSKHRAGDQSDEWLSDGPATGA
jgi:hypothetical protein